MPHDSTPSGHPSSQSELFGKVPKSIYPDHRIDGNAKILFAEIIGLAKAEGYCYATNGYFAEMFDVSESTIVRWLRQIEEANYVMSQFIKSPRGTERRLYIRNGPPIESLRSDAEALANVIDRVGIPRPSQDKLRGVNSATPATTNDIHGAAIQTGGVSRLLPHPVNSDTPGVAELTPDKIILRDYLKDKREEAPQTPQGGLASVVPSEMLRNAEARHAVEQQEKQRLAAEAQALKAAEDERRRGIALALKNARDVFNELPPDEIAAWRDAARQIQNERRAKFGQGIDWPEMTEEVFTTFALRLFEASVTENYPNTPSLPNMDRLSTAKI